MHDRDVAVADRVGAEAQVVRRHALQHDRRRDLQVDPGRHRDDTVRGDRHLPGVASGRVRPGHAVTHGQPGDAVAHRGDRARTLRAGDHRKLGRLIPADAFPLVDVHVVDAGRGDPDDHLARARFRVRDLGDAENLGAAQLPGDDRAHADHAPCLDIRPTTGSPTIERLAGLQGSVAPPWPPGVAGDADVVDLDGGGGVLT